MAALPRDELQSHEEDTIRIPPLPQGALPAPLESAGRTVTFATTEDQGDDAVRASISSMRSSFSFIHILRPRTSLADLSRATTPTPLADPRPLSSPQPAQPLSRWMTNTVKGFFK